jgi:type III restriction enzyme
MTIKLQFSPQAHQAKAVAAVTKVFNGRPLAWSDLSLTGQNASVVHAVDGTFRWRGIR